MYYELRFDSGQFIQKEVLLPASKSISNRALIISALAKGNHEIHNLSQCDDTYVMQEGLTTEVWDAVDVMAAGTAMRFLTAYFCVTPGYHYITGTERMQQRPIWPLVDALRRLGANIEYAEKDGFPPLEINGQQLTGDTVALQGDISSQYISALLMIAPTLPSGLRILLTGRINSVPYIDMTMQLMREFGAELDWVRDDCIVVKPVPYKKEMSYTVEADWSAASYWYQIAALSNKAEIRLKNLYKESLQGDKRVAEWFKMLGVDTIYSGQDVIISKNPDTILPHRLNLNFSDMPDLAQTFVVTCAMLRVSFCFSGLETLRIKETDRIHALVAEMEKLGVQLDIEDDNMLAWNGVTGRVEEMPLIQTYDDHRMAMAFAPIAMVNSGIAIENPGVVSKSYPEFWDHLLEAGFSIREV